MKIIIPRPTPLSRAGWRQVTRSCLALALTLVTWGAPSANEYDIISLGTDFRPTDITDNGLVSGISAGTPSQARYYDSSETITIENSAVASGINENGMIAGYRLGSPYNQGILWSGSTVEPELSNFSNILEGRSINNFDETVGTRLVEGQYIRPFVHEFVPGILKTLGTLGGAHAWATDTNSSGMIVGASLNEENKVQAFRHIRESGFQRLPFLDAYDSAESLDVSDDGHIVGHTYLEQNPDYAKRAFIAPLNQGVINLGSLNNDPISIANGVNNSGLIVGQSIKADNSSRAFRYDTADADLLVLTATPLVPQVLYAGSATGGGALKSTDGGTNWFAINLGLTESTINTMIVHPIKSNTIYAGTINGVFKSSNGGVSWSKPSQDLDGRQIFGLFITADDTLLAGSDQSMYFSTDGGDSWTIALTESVHGIGVFAFIQHPQTDALFMATSRGVYRSKDDGRTWDRQNGSLVDTTDYRLRSQFVSSLLIDPDAPAFLYAGTVGGGVYRASAASDNTLSGSLRWESISVDLVDRNIYALAVDTSPDPNIIYAGAASRLSHSDDGGDTWQQTTGFGSRGAYSMTITQDGSLTTLYITSFDGGIYRSDDGDPDADLGIVWTTVTRGTSTADIFDLSFAGTDSLYATASSGAFVRTTGTTDPWSIASTGITNLKTTTIKVDDSTTPHTLWAGTIDNGIYQSTDGGDTWLQVNSGLNHWTVFDIEADLGTTPATVYAATTGGVYRSDNGGTSWNIVSNGLDQRPAFCLLVDDSVSPKLVYTGTNDGIFRSSDGGEHWTQLKQGMNTAAEEAAGIKTEIVELKMRTVPQKEFYAASLSKGILQSSDDGANWINITNNLSSPTVYSLALDNTGIYAGTTQGVHFAQFGLWTWQLRNNGLEDETVYALEINPNDNTMYAGTADNGAYENADRTIDTTPWQQTNIGLGTTIDLMQDLSTLQDDPDWTLLDASAINNVGQIVGWGDYNGNEQGFLLTPKLGIAKADLHISQVTYPETIKANTPVSFQLTVTNLGPDTATDVYLTNWLPSNALYRHAGSSQGSCIKEEDISTVRCQILAINKGETVQLEITVEPQEPEIRLLNIARVNSNEYDQKLANNSTTYNNTVSNNAVTDKCFIATAAYGSFLDPHVTTLRHFRDRYLMPYESGRILVGFYYQHSPPLANTIAKHEALKITTQAILTPIVYSIEYPWLGPTMLLGLMLLMRRRQQNKLVRVSTHAHQVQ